MILSFSTTTIRSPKKDAAAAPRNSSLFDRGRKLTDADITHLEEAIGRPLPETYRRYLMTFNGGGPDPRFLDIEGAPYAHIKVSIFFSIDIQDEGRELLRRWESGPGCKERQLFPIGCDDDDSYLVLDLNDAKLCVPQ